jgi:hypothetical protein
LDQSPKTTEDSNESEGAALESGDKLRITGTVTARVQDGDESGGCGGGCISGDSGAISHEPENAESPVFAGKTELLIVEDSSGNYYLMGDTGLEPVTPSV